MWRDLVFFTTNAGVIRGGYLILIRERTNVRSAVGIVDVRLTNNGNVTFARIGVPIAANRIRWSCARTLNM